MEHKLLTERGRKLYKNRGKTVEPVLDQIKEILGFDRFYGEALRLAKVNGRSYALCIIF